MCDVNGLKSVNDNYGHQYGDMMLQVVADVLDKVCPKQCFVARTGGDEFIYLLPHTTAEDACTLMVQVREALTNCKKTPFALSMALGTATKYSVEEDLNDVIDFADSRMYEDKKNTKEQMEQKQWQSMSFNMRGAGLNFRPSWPEVALKLQQKARMSLNLVFGLMV